MGIGSEFMRETQYENMSDPDQKRGIKQPPLYSRWGGEPAVALPEPPVLEADERLVDMVGQRRSLREYADAGLSLDELSLLLWGTQGVQRTIEGRATFRTVPSAGARHALETLLLANRVDDLRPGLYQYVPSEHALALLKAESNLAERIEQACLGQTIVGASAVTWIWAVELQRMTWRYGERGFRYVHLDAGHVCQNLYLLAEAVGAGACAIGAFDDAALNGVLGLDGQERFVVYAAAVGKRKAAEV